MKRSHLRIPVILSLIIGGIILGVLFPDRICIIVCVGNEPPLLDVANAAGTVVAVDGIHTYAVKDMQTNVAFKVEVQGFKIGDKVCIQLHSSGERHIHPLRFCQ